MLRLTPIAMLFATLVLAPAGSAAADDCMCLPAELSWSTSLSDRLALIQSSEGDTPVFGETAFDESIEIGPFFSSDGTLLSSRVPALAQGRRVPPVDVLWCVDANDPRCSGGDPAPGQSVFDGHASQGAALAGSLPDLPEPEPAASSPRAALLGASAGYASRLDRPPRR